VRSDDDDLIVRVAQGRQQGRGGSCLAVGQGELGNLAMDERDVRLK